MNHLVYILISVQYRNLKAEEAREWDINILPFLLPSYFPMCKFLKASFRSLSFLQKHAIYHIGYNCILLSSHTVEIYDIWQMAHLRHWVIISRTQPLATIYLSSVIQKVCSLNVVLFIHQVVGVSMSISRRSEIGVIMMCLGKDSPEGNHLLHPLASMTLRLL